MAPEMTWLTDGGANENGVLSPGNDPTVRPDASFTSCTA